LDGIILFWGRLLKTTVVSNLTENQSLILNGPGAIKINAAKTISISKTTGIKAGAGQLGAAKLGALLHVMGPLLGFALLSGGTFYLAKQWLRQKD
jgi:hypothetical protein